MRRGVFLTAVCVALLWWALSDWTEPQSTIPWQAINHDAAAEVAREYASLIAGCPPNPSGGGAVSPDLKTGQVDVDLTVYWRPRSFVFGQVAETIKQTRVHVLMTYVGDPDGDQFDARNWFIQLLEVERNYKPPRFRLNGRIINGG